MLLRHLASFLLLLCTLLCGCGKKEQMKHEIAMDPSWYPLNFQNKNNNIVGFSTELLRSISSEEFTTFSVLYTNWDSLQEGLISQQYGGILSSIYPYNFNQKKYSFSETYLPTGPVLILDKPIAALTGSSSITLLETYPKIIISFCNSIGDLVNQLQSGQVIGALLPWPVAQSFMQGSFQKQFMLASGPLNDEGLRLITLKGQDSSLIRRFNHGLEKLKKNGRYDQLLIDWGIVPPPPSS
jgi:polar amino acid transport system substrate-binding protein